MSKRISIGDLKELLVKSVPFIDVRAPVEYSQGFIPGAVNLPILSDEERALVGVSYKNEGSEAATALGHKLVSGEIKEARIQAWRAAIQKNPDTVIYCFRGGQRSQITQRWLAEIGIDRPIIAGGYKAARNLLISELDRVSEERPFLIVSGPTGSGKTELLNEVQGSCAVLDLEGIAIHRGSAFGARDLPQPSQANFENLVAAELLKLGQEHPAGALIVEDESRLIGRCYLPTSLFQKMRSSQVVWVDEPIAERVEHILKLYVVETAIGEYLQGGSEQNARRTFEKYRRSVQAIHKRLGGLRTQEVLESLATAEKNLFEKGEIADNRVWIEQLLLYYYDPMYLGSLQKRNVSIAFKGLRTDCKSYLESL